MEELVTGHLELTGKLNEGLVFEWCYLFVQLPTEPKMKMSFYMGHIFYQNQLTYIIMYLITVFHFHMPNFLNKKTLRFMAQLKVMTDDDL